MKKLKRHILLVTGLSGAGLSTALKALEDIGYETVDNLPLFLVDGLVGEENKTDQPIAIGIDSRTRDFTFDAFVAQYQKLKDSSNFETKLLFVTCSNSILQQRFAETRRRHPLAIHRPILDGVNKERVLLEPLLSYADLVLDTTELSVHDLRRSVVGNFSVDDGSGLLVFVTSFGFKNGTPREADIVFDVRFLDNPHYDLNLRPLTGKHDAVAKKVSSDAGYEPFFDYLTQLLKFSLPRYEAEGKKYLTISIGCTGGRHRSVFVAEELFKYIDKCGYSVAIKHRDLEKWAIQQKMVANEVAGKDNTQEEMKRKSA